MIIHLSIKQILIQVFSYTLFVEFGNHESRTQEMDQIQVQCGQVLALSASPSSPSSQTVTVFTLYLLMAEMQWVFVWTNICWIRRWNLLSFFPSARSELGFLQVRSWCSDIAEQRMKKQSIRLCCCVLLSSAPTKYTFQPISKQSGKRQLIILFKQSLSRDIAYFGGPS